jgi:glycosyltransferase involved in cell wall biosynthesis
MSNINILKNNNSNQILIVMPTYNRPNNIENSIQMILDQIFTNWIFLIIDDGSTEINKMHFRNIKEQYNDNKKIIFWENEINCNIAKTLNRGIDYLLNTENQFTHFTWISDDNKYYPNFLTILVDQNNYFKYSSYKIKNNAPKLYTHKNKYLSYCNILHNWNGCASFMWTKEAIKQIGFYKEFLQGCEDYEYLIRTFKLNYNECKHSIIPLVTYVIHDDSLCERTKLHVFKLNKLISQYYSNDSNDYSLEQYIALNS